MKKLLKYVVSFFQPGAESWALEARLLSWLTCVWLFIGLVTLFSASYPVADAEYQDGLYYVKRQLLWFFIGFIGFHIIVRSPLKYWLGTAKWFMLMLLGLILVTLIPGVGNTVNGATRWISIGPFDIQPSELIKPFLILQSACVFGQWQKLSWRVRIGWLVAFAAILGGILLQPNLSTTALCGITLWLIALAAGLPMLQLGGTALGGLLLATISISIQDYQRRRVMSFLNPWSDQMGDGYQLIQSLLAVGSGGTWGARFGLSQQKLFYLPIQYTDFIFAVFAEEFGFVGSVVLLVMLVSYATLALIVAFKCRQKVQQLVAIGVMVLLVGQSLINIGVATGALPTTGLPLPLFSYGGSSTISSLVLAALLIRVARESNEAEIVPLLAQSQTRSNSTTARRKVIKPRRN